MAFRFGERGISGRVEFRTREELLKMDLLEQMGVPERARGLFGRWVAQPCYFRALSDYNGEVDFGGEVVPPSGETIMEYMVFDRRRGSVPAEGRYAHFLHP